MDYLCPAGPVSICALHFCVCFWKLTESFLLQDHSLDRGEFGCLLFSQMTQFPFPVNCM